MKRRRVEVMVQSEGKGKIADPRADRGLEIVTGCDDLVVHDVWVDHSAKIDMRAAMSADLDPRGGQLAKLLDRVGARIAASPSIVSEWPALEHGPRGNEAS